MLLESWDEQYYSSGLGGQELKKTQQTCMLWSHNYFAFNMQLGRGEGVGQGRAREKEG